MSDPGPKPDPTPSLSPSDSTVNPQIIDAVAKSTDFVFGLRDVTPPKDITNRLKAGSAIAYEKAAQAGALAIQDATDYQRNIMSISTAAQGKALAILIADQSQMTEMIVVIAAAMACTLVATATAGLVGAEVNETLKNFPKN